jgi:hypothetical protein
MAVTAKQIIDKTQLYIEDHDAEHFTREEVLNEINSVRREHISSVNNPYTRKYDQVLYDGQEVYEFPGDLIRMTHAYLHILGTKRRIGEGYFESEEPTSVSQVAIYRERVSSNEYELLPATTSELASRMSGATGNIEKGVIPSSGLVGDLWVDDDNVINRCETEYSVGTTEFTLTSERVVPLQFLAVETSAYIEVSITSGGATGTSTLSKIGSGTYASPYKYSFVLHDDDSSNDAVIALLVGDADLTAIGADANNVTVVPYALTPLTWTHQSNWTPLKLEVHYRAELPDFFSEDDTLHPSIANPLRSGEALAKLAAANLLIYMRGNPNSISAFRQDGLQILSENRFQTNRRMGPVSFSPGYGLRY